MSLKHSILAVLSSEAKTGYQLSKDVTSSIGFFWQATHQQIYRDLAELQKSEWVEHTEVSQKEKPDKKVYSLTEAGHRELVRWMKDPSEVPPARDQFLIKLWVGHLVGPQAILKDLAQQKQIHESRKKQLEIIAAERFADPTSLPIEQRYMFLTLRRGLLLGTAWLNWCQEVEEFLGQVAEK